jgi:hypothetical protein
MIQEKPENQSFICREIHTQAKTKEEVEQEDLRFADSFSTFSR